MNKRLLTVGDLATTAQVLEAHNRVPFEAGHEIVRINAIVADEFVAVLQTFSHHFRECLYYNRPCNERPPSRYACNSRSQALCR